MTNVLKLNIKKYLYRSPVWTIKRLKHDDDETTTNIRRYTYTRIYRAWKSLDGRDTTRISVGASSFRPFVGVPHTERTVENLRAGACLEHERLLRVLCPDSFSLDEFYSAKDGLLFCERYSGFGYRALTCLTCRGILFICICAIQIKRIYAHFCSFSQCSRVKNRLITLCRSG